MDTGVYYERSEIKDLLVNKENVKEGDADSIINAFKRLCALPLGTAFDFGSGKHKDSIRKSKCNL